MPVAFFIKTPIPFLCLLVVALYQLLRKRRCSTAEWLILVTCVFFFAMFMHLKSSNVGLRYILPTLPLLFLLASRLLQEGAQIKRPAQLAVLVLTAWYAVGTIRIYPHHLAYFNEFIGGPANGYRYLADSFLDWGQDLKGLKDYMEDHDIDRIRLAYFGSADANYYGIDYEYLPSVGLAPREPGEHWWYDVDTKDLPALDLSRGPVAISASLLAGVFLSGYYAPLKELEPVDQVGHSILIYEP